MATCCGDLLPPDAAPAALAAARGDAGPLLAAAASAEAALRSAALATAFAGGGGPAPPADVAAALGLPLNRTTKLLQFAARGIELRPSAAALEVLHECADFVAVNKPPGVRTTPAHRFADDSMLNRCVCMLDGVCCRHVTPPLVRRSSRVYTQNLPTRRRLIAHLGFTPHLLHRLDTDTSGVLLAAKTPAVARWAHAAFEARGVRKTYLALCAGSPPEGSSPAQGFDAEQPIGRHASVGVARAVHGPGAKPAFTACEVLATVRGPALLAAPWPGSNTAAAPAAGSCAAPDVLDRAAAGATLLRCGPRTGRTHQIRLHAAAAGLPLLGDPLYGVTGPWLNRHALHAAVLELPRPDGRRALRVAAPLPADMADVAALLGLEAGLAAAAAAGRGE
jgi:23S rRNA-/tRNA-specific pseudouridylate synthase